VKTLGFFTAMNVRMSMLILELLTPRDQLFFGPIGQYFIKTIKIQTQGFPYYF